MKRGTMDNFFKPGYLGLSSEVWSLVFEQFAPESPKELNNVRFVCKYFRDVIDSLPQRKHQKVLHLIGHKRFEMADLYKLRQVSKWAKSAVDGMLDNFEYFKNLQLPIWNRLNDFISITMMRPLLTFSDVQQMTECFQFYPVTQNPFVGRSLRVEKTEDCLEPICLNRTLPLLSRWGSHLKTLCVTDIKNDDGYDTVTMQKMIHAVPNVTCLEWSFQCLSNNMEQNSRYGAIIQLPPLPKLVELSVAYGEHVGGAIASKFIVQYANQITLLQIVSLTTVLPDLSGETRSLLFPELKDFRLDMPSEEFAMTVYQQWKMPKLKDMSLDMTDENWDETSFQEMVLEISKFVGKTLERLAISCFIMEEEPNPVPIFPKECFFPKLTKLILQGIELDDDIDVTAIMPSIKKLVLDA